MPSSLALFFIRKGLIEGFLAALSTPLCGVPCSRNGASARVAGRLLKSDIPFFSIPCCGRHTPFCSFPCLLVLTDGSYFSAGQSCCSEYAAPAVRGYGASHNSGNESVVDGRRQTRLSRAAWKSKVGHGKHRPAVARG